MLTVIFAMALARVIGFSIQFGRSSIQMDFSAFYTAGEALNEGLSPYENYITNSKPIWDGVDTFTHSRYLYPPLAANFFQAIALLPYYWAKHLWMLISLVCLFLSVFIPFRVVTLRHSFAHSPEIPLIVGIFVCLYYPLLPFLERGQIDSVTLLLLIVGISMMVIERNSMWSGILFSLATLFKLHSIFLLPFLVLRKRWITIAGYVAGSVLIIILTLAFNGRDLTVGYILDEMPRISRYGEGGTEAMKLSDDERQAVLKDIPSGFTVKDGRIYLNNYFGFVPNATLRRTEAADVIGWIGRLFRLDVSITVLSVLFFSAFFAIILFWEGLHRFKLQETESPNEFAYWLMVLTVILLSAPSTWVMNTIWLLPITVVFIHQYLKLSSTPPDLKTMFKVFSLCVGTTGLLVAGIPDHIGFRMLLPYGEGLLAHKYVISELLIFAGLLGLLHFERTLERNKP